MAHGHVIVLESGTTTIRAAPPFSAVPTPFLVRSGASAWYAPCAWDSFGIPAALKHGALIEARCAWSGDPLPCGVEHGGSYGDGFIHLLVPAAGLRFARREVGLRFAVLTLPAATTGSSIRLKVDVQQPLSQFQGLRMDVSPSSRSAAGRRLA